MGSTRWCATASRLILVASLTFFVTVLVAQRATAQPSCPTGLPFLWQYPNNVVIIDWTQTLNDQVDSSRTDYHYNTDLSVYEGPTNDHYGDYYNLTSNEHNYGASGLYGWADIYTEGVQCSQDGWLIPDTCDMEEHRADFAHTYFNYRYVDDWDDLDVETNGAFRNKFVRHEWGHVFSLAHVQCATPSVENLWCVTTYGTLQSHDIDFIECWY